LVREVGRGGMGIVFEAVQESLGRRVALKILPPQASLNPTYLDRFRREAEAAARLHHTNIVPVYGVGEAGGVRFYAMQFIAGRGLDQFLSGPGGRDPTTQPATTPGGLAPVALSPGRAVPLPPREVARIGLQAAEALAYAHAHGVLHRDVKPSNLLLDEQGTVWVTDFGLAKLAESDDLTGTGDVVGTLRYLAPERLHGQTDARSDVCSLGLTLYELLTGRPAFDAPDRAQLLRQIGEQDPPRPRQLRPEVPRDLETVVLKAMAREPQRRYADAAALAEDLRRFLVHEPIRARRVGLAERLGKWVRRRPALASLLAVSGAALAALVVTLAVSNAQVSDALAEQTKAKNDLQVANQELGKKTTDLEEALGREKEERYWSFVGLAARELAANNVAAADQLLDQCPDGLRNWEWHYLKRQCRAMLASVEFPAETVTALAFTPDGSSLVACTLHGGTGVGQVRFLAPRSGKEIRNLPLGKEGVFDLALNPDGSRLAVSQSRDLKLLEAATGKELWSLGRIARHLHFLEGGRLFAYSGEKAILYDAATGATESSSPLRFPDGIVLSRDRKIAAGYEYTATKTVLVYNPASGEVRARLLMPDHLPQRTAEESKIVGVTFSPDQRLVAAATAHRVALWELPTTPLPPGKKGGGEGRLLWHFPAQGGVRCLEFHPDGTQLAVGRADRAVTLLDWKTGQPRRTLRGPRFAIDGLAFHPRGHLLAARCGQSLCVWDPADESEAITIPCRAPPRVSYHHAVSPDGRWIALIRNDTREFLVGNKVHRETVHHASLLSAESGKVVRSWGGAGGARPIFSPAEPRLALPIQEGFRDVRVDFRDIDTGRVVSSLEQTANTVCISPDGRYLGLVQLVQKGTVILVWDLAQRHPVLQKPSARVRALAFHPQRSWLASAGDDNAVRIWDYRAGGEALPPLNHHAQVMQIRFSPDGRKLASYCFDRGKGMLKLWDIATGTACELPDAEGTSGGGVLSFSPDSRFLAGYPAGDRGSFALWETATGKKVRQFVGHADVLKSLHFFPDGSRLVSGSADRTVKLWDPRNGRELVTLSGHSQPVEGIAYSDDGGRLITWSLHEIKIWNGARE
jgi:WD40 repeat protein